MPFYTSFTRQYHHFSLKICIAMSLTVSPYALAQNSLVQQALDFQSGTDTVGIDHQKAIALLKQAVHSGDAEAMYLLSQYYTNKGDFRYLPENPRLSRDLLTKAEKLGNWDAIDQIITEGNVETIFFNKNSNVKQRNTILKPILDKGIKNNDPRALMLMGDLLNNPNSSHYSLEQCKWYYKAYQAGDQWSALYTLKTFCYDEDLKKLKAPPLQELRELFYNHVHQEVAKYKTLKNPILDQKIEISNLVQMNLTDDLSEFSQQLDKEVHKGISDFYTKQAKQGYSDAYIKLAKDKNDKEKNKLYMQAAQLNNPIALTFLGDFYLYPPEESKQKPNIKLGIQYLEKAIQLNNADAMNTLAVWYSNNSQKPQDQIIAKNLFLRSIALGSVDSMQNLARISDEPESYRLAAMAFENGGKSDDILEMAQKAYAEGLGIPKNKAMATLVEQRIKGIETDSNTISEKLGLKMQ